MSSTSMITTARRMLSTMVERRRDAESTTMLGANSWLLVVLAPAEPPQGA